MLYQNMTSTQQTSPLALLFSLTDASDCMLPDGTKVRKTCESPQQVSIHDLIAIICGLDSNAARNTWRKMQNDYADVAAMRHCYQFAGRAQRPTPVTDARGVMLILNFLPGNRAARIRAASADIIARCIGGDLSLIAEVRQNAVVQRSLPADSVARMFGEDVESVDGTDETPRHGIFDLFSV
jgi:hypothetical protein